MKYHIFVDFDGTITKTDTLEYLLDTFGDENWREIEERIGRGEIGEIEGLRREFTKVKATRKEALIALDKVVKIDDGFPDFCHWSREKKIPLTILSGGFRFIIEYFLIKFGLSGLEYFSNEAVVLAEGWKIIPYGGWGECFLCNHCKSSHLLKAKKKGKTNIYIGDGNTDRCAARYAEILFAKGSLARHAEAQNLPFFPYNDFSDVAAKLSRLLTVG
jgi:2-hydroxy-3-keto-5-methylthiopentenyl-1-phosphate phosphatase